MHTYMHVFIGQSDATCIDKAVVEVKTEKRGSHAGLVLHRGIDGGLHDRQGLWARVLIEVIRELGGGDRASHEEKHNEQEARHGEARCRSNGGSH